METYKKLEKEYLCKVLYLKKRINLIIFIRLISFILFISLVYYYLKYKDDLFLILFLLILAFFIVSIKIHKKLKSKKKLAQTLAFINKEEIVYLDGKEIPFEDGNEYQNISHIYANDLDLFGKNSLFAHLNRTCTYEGKEKLAHILLDKLSNEQILENQEAIKELSAKLSFRQFIRAEAFLAKGTKKETENLKIWSSKKTKKIPKFIYFLAFLFPLLFLIAIVSNIFSINLYSNFSIIFFFFNLVLLLSQIEKIKKELIHSDQICNTLAKYSLILKKIETEKFVSFKLKNLQSKLSTKNTLANKQIKKLASLFSQLENIQNPLGAILLNGICLYHLHTLKNLIKWKKENAFIIFIWFEVLAEMEMLSSLANYYFNNPDFSFPSLNKNHEISFKNLGHPLLTKNKRITNSIQFNENNFIILTGSNMSGKSTFLRALGINLLLASIGAPICASESYIHPLKIITLMRAKDSLSEGESYFFAEIKKLKIIIEELQKHTCFVLLDEILRGTNSKDKQMGTIKIIEKMMNLKAIGVIATHDLEVCLISEKHPTKLFNKCFESKILDNELTFDYKLKSGVCQNANALCLMQQLNII